MRAVVASRVLFVCAELFPIAKTGGLADACAALPKALAGLDLLFVLHGEGDPALENAFAAAGASARVVLRVGDCEALAHRLTAGADISLIPSRFEPCGLTALYAMRYGTLPVSRKVGGLADSVVDAGDAALPRSGATGFSFAEQSHAGLLAGLVRALARFASRDTWQLMQRTAMTRDFSWDTAARRYLELYRTLLPGFAFDDAVPRRRVA